MTWISFPWPWSRREAKGLAEHYADMFGQDSLDAIILTTALRNGCVPAEGNVAEKGDTLIEIGGRKFIMRAFKFRPASSEWDRHWNPNYNREMG